MNWRLTRSGQWVRFDAGEAIAHIMPVQRGLIEQWEPELVPMREKPDLLDSSPGGPHHGMPSTRRLPAGRLDVSGCLAEGLFPGLDMNGGKLTAIKPSFVYVRSNQ